MAKIEDLLQRRNDLSTFLVHLTRDTGTETARANLLRILDREVVEARSVYGMGKAYEDVDSEFQNSQRVVFTETPLEHVWMMCQDIESRSMHFSHYGLAVTKSWARRNHINPVWYLDISSRGGPDWLTQPINRLLERAYDDSVEDEEAPLADSDIAKIAPFIEQMGPMRSGGRKEFWWEREWRHVGHLHVPWQHIVAVFAPNNQHSRLLEQMTEGVSPKYTAPPLLDPRWGLERMIASLAHIDAADAGPLPR
jgi:hypothetical protein